MSAVTNVPAAREAARLMVSYEAVKTALAECQRLAACKDWADKAVALEIYARMANDHELELQGRRIRLRAIQRQGQLLLAIDAAKNQHDAASRAGRGVPTGRMAAAKEAGLSRDQALTAVAIARVTPAEFERAVESSTPPSVTALVGFLPGASEAAKRRDEADEEAVSRGHAPKDRRIAIGLIEALGSLRAALQEDMGAMIRGTWPRERRVMLRQYAEILPTLALLTDVLKKAADGE